MKTRYRIIKREQERSTLYFQIFQTIFVKKVKLLTCIWVCQSKLSFSFTTLRNIIMQALLIIPIMMTASPVVMAQTSKQSLVGKRLILDDAQCAGWQFKNAATVLRFDEMICSHSGQPSFQTRIRWITQDKFILVESSQEKRNMVNTPRVWFYKIESITGSKVVLKETWLGWGEFQDSTELYRIKK